MDCVGGFQGPAGRAKIRACCQRRFAVSFFILRHAQRAFRHPGSHRPGGRGASGEAPVIAWSVELKPNRSLFWPASAMLRHPFAGIAFLRRPSAKLRAAVRALREVSALEQILQNTAHSGAVSRRRSFVAESVFLYLLSADFWEKTLPRLGSGAVFTTTESLHLCKGLFDAARRRNLRAVHFCHGFRHAMHQVTRSTDLCVFSKPDSEWFLTRVEKDCMVRAIGNPRLETIREMADPPRHRESSERFRLLFFSQDAETPYTAEMTRADMAILAAAPETRAKYVLRLRSHRRQLPDELLNMARELGLKVDEFSRRAPAEDISWRDPAPTPWSTALLEAAVGGRPCYRTDAGGHGFGGRANCKEPAWDCEKRPKKNGRRPWRNCFYFKWSRPLSCPHPRLTNCEFALKARFHGSKDCSYEAVTEIPFQTGSRRAM